jgi:glycerol-3-phosphate acyltransferase PlsX
MAETLRAEIRSSPISSIGGLLAKPAFGRVRRQLDPEEVGGAPLLGVNGVVIIGHGRSGAYAIKQAVGQARVVAQSGVVKAIETVFRNGSLVIGES